MFADDLPFGVDEISTLDLLFQIGQTAFEEPPVIVVRYKTNLVTLRFFRQFGVPSVKGNLPHFRFAELPYRELSTLQGFLTQAPQYIRLILVGVGPFADVFAAIQFLDLGIMPSGDELTIQRVGAFQ